MALFPDHIVYSLWQRRELIRQLVIREVVQRYRGSYLGLLWSILNPLLILVVYAIVFTYVLQVRWSSTEAEVGPGDFALLLFAGLIPFNVLAETLARSPGLITAVPNYVKKVVFPLEVLPVVAVASALFQSLVSIAVLLIFSLVLRNGVHAPVILLPLAYLPLVLLCLGVAWLLSSVAVFVRDLTQAVTPIVQVLVFASPVFYPVTGVPDQFRWLLYLNPLTPIIEAFRAALIGPDAFPWPAWAASTLAGGVIAIIGFAWFSQTRAGFSDVL